MTDLSELVEEARRLSEAATSGPWQIEIAHDVDYGDSAAIRGVCGPFVTGEDGIIFPLAPADAAFIAWCRQGVPALIAALDDAQAELGIGYTTWQDTGWLRRFAQTTEYRDRLIGVADTVDSLRSKLAQATAALEQAKADTLREAAEVIEGIVEPGAPSDWDRGMLSAARIVRRHADLVLGTEQ